MLSTTVGDSVRSYQTALQQALGQISADIMSQIALEILAAYDRDGRTFVFGNGGSAATASHMACDLSKNTVTDGIPHLCCCRLKPRAAPPPRKVNNTMTPRCFLSTFR